MFSLQDANIHNIAVVGVFDDCQDIVKAVSNDLVFKRHHHIGTVNSINWARLLAQVVYYFAGYFQATTSNAQAVSFAVPSGNFGNTLSINCDNPLLGAGQRSAICDGENLLVSPLPGDAFVVVGNVAAENAARQARGLGEPLLQTTPFNFINPLTGTTYNRAFAQILRRFDEGAADVPVLDEPVVVGDAAGAAEADGGGDGRVGDGDDDVGVDGVLGRQLLAEPLPDVVDAAARPHAVGAAEVHELERAAGLGGRGCEGGSAVDLGAVQGDDLAGAHLVDVDAPEGGERAGLGCDGVAAVGEAADAEGPEAPRVAHGDDAIGCQHDQ
jgi:hypothetical protein